MTADRSDARPQERSTARPPRAQRSVAPRTAKTVAVAAQLATPPAVPAPPRRASRDQFVDGQTYDSPIRGPFGTELILSGISSTRGGSLAIVNGNLVRAGATVGPFVIEEIEPRRVRVRYVDVRFWLTH